MRLAFLLIPSLALAGQFSTSLGGEYPVTISAITTDSAGNTYVVGSRQIPNPPVINDATSAEPIYLSYSAGYTSDVFLSKLDPNGNVLFTDAFGGKGSDSGAAVALDPSGNIYIAGNTTSPDFPLSKAIQTQIGMGPTGFVMKISNDGSTILYSTFFGGTLGSSAVTALATDAQGNLYLTGTTTSSDFPHTTGLPFGPNPLVPSNTAVFMTSISAAGDKILYSGALVSGPIPIAGGTVNPSAAGVAIDSSGDGYFAGNLGGGTPLTATQGVLPGSLSFTGFAMKVNSGGSLGYLTPLPTNVSAIAVDPSGDLFFAGYEQSEYPSPPNAGVSKLNPTASAILWSNNFSGLANPISSLALDSSGDAWASGSTLVAGFPNQGWTAGSEFLAEVSSTGQLKYSALYPVGTTDAVGVDSSGLVHIAGSSGFVSTINPVALAPLVAVSYLTNVFGGNATARISPAEVISIYGPGIGPSMPATAVPTNGFYPKTLAGVQVQINGVNIPLLYVSANQINAVVPMSAPYGASATILVITGASVTPEFPVWLPNGAGQAFPTVLNQDGTINSQSNPAALNSVVTFYATGWQTGFPSLSDGEIATTAQNVCMGAGSCGVLPVDTLPYASVIYAGAAPGIVAGVTQFNVLIGTDGAMVGQSNVVGPYTFSVTGAGFGTVSQTVWVKD